MESIHVVEEYRILLFILQLAILVGLARGLGLLFSQYGQPSITAEILVGVLLGPTVLGRLFPGLYQHLFPHDPLQYSMLEGVAWLGILFFLLDTGLQTDFSSAWRQRFQAITISLTDLTIPMVIAFVPCLFIPDHFLVDPQSRFLFALFVATIMTISALPVTARVLQDLNLYRTDTGLLIMGALTINDIAGWLVFAVILGMASETVFGLKDTILILVYTILFAVLSLSVGRPVVNRILEQFSRWKLPEPGAPLTLICLLGLLGGSLTTWIGIHALFGFFIAGMVSGEAHALKENTRQVIHQMVHAFLVPIFFTTVGLKIDFARGFHLGLVLLMLAVGITGRLLGAWVGCLLTRQPRTNRVLISIAHIPGGEMQIVIGMLAMQYGIISESVYVAIIVSALASSIILGPWMSWVMKSTTSLSVSRYFMLDGIILDLKAHDRNTVVQELCQLAEERYSLHGDQLFFMVMEREESMGTALGNGIAVPHARLPNLKQPVVIMGRSLVGIDWNAPDGLPVHLIFLLVTSLDDPSQQIRMISVLAKALKQDAIRKELMEADTQEKYYGILQRVMNTIELQEGINTP